MAQPAPQNEQPAATKERAPQDPVADLIQKLQTGKARLKFDPDRGYLPSLVRALQVPVSSQVLAFSKTSSQAKWTSPNTPRAIYFSDNVSVAWEPGADVIDLAAVDPQRGAVLYTLEQKPAKTPTFTRRENCLACHQNQKTFDVPGLVLRSVYTAPDGTPLANVDGFVAGHQAPLEARWGGWYVTGLLPGVSHLGNQFVPDVKLPEARITLVEPDLQKLKPQLKSAHYLAGTSDVVALMILEHQVRMQTLLTLAHAEAVQAQADLNAESDPLARQAAQDRIALIGETVLACLLFRDEVPLSGKIAGDSTFVSEFQRPGPRDAKGRSLRDLDLHSRLFRYPCSFLIYSKSWDELPKQMKDFLEDRLIQVLTGKDSSPTYAGFGAPDRQAVLEILLATKSTFRKRADDTVQISRAAVQASVR